MASSEGTWIRFKGWKLLLLFAPFAVLLGISLALHLDEWLSKSSWPHVVVGAVVLFVLVGSVVMPARHYLHLTPDGLTVGTLLGAKQFRWHEVRNFRVVNKSMNAVPIGTLIAFDLAEDSPHRTTAIRLASAVNGFDYCITSLFSLGPEEVAALLNTWQMQHGDELSDDESWEPPRMEE